VPKEKKMKIGDLVKIKKGIKHRGEIASQVGLILDEYEDMTTTHYEVQFTYECGWFDEFELEVLSGIINRVIKDV